jgi:hypothetical protein
VNANVRSKRMKQFLKLFLWFTVAHFFLILISIPIHGALTRGNPGAFWITCGMIIGFPCYSIHGVPDVIPMLLNSIIIGLAFALPLAITRKLQTQYNDNKGMTEHIGAP